MAISCDRATHSGAGSGTDHTLAYEMWKHVEYPTADPVCDQAKPTILSADSNQDICNHSSSHGSSPREKLASRAAEAMSRQAVPASHLCEWDTVEASSPTSIRPSATATSWLWNHETLSSIRQSICSWIADPQKRCVNVLSATDNV